MHVNLSLPEPLRICQDTHLLFLLRGGGDKHNTKLKKKNLSYTETANGCTGATTVPCLLSRPITVWSLCFSISFPGAHLVCKFKIMHARTHGAQQDPLLGVITCGEGTASLIASGRRVSPKLSAVCRHFSCKSLEQAHRGGPGEERAPFLLTSITNRLPEERKSFPAGEP